MRNQISVLLIAAVILLWCAPEANGYGAAEFKVCAYSKSQSYPAVAGGVVVWQDDRNGNEDIYGYDAFTKTEFGICTDEASQSFPAISGDIVVWEDERNGDKDIYGYDLSTHSRFIVCTESADQEQPAINGGIIVWRDNRNAGWDIYGYDLSEQSEFVICAGPNDQYSPAVSGDIVVWWDYRSGSADIYAYDLSGKSEFPICAQSADQYSPAISGDIIVWEDYRNGNADIYAYDLSTKSEFPICTNGADQYSPAINGDIIVWCDGRNGSGTQDIYAYDLSTQSEFAVCAGDWLQDGPAISGDIVAWRDYRSSSSDIYSARISKGDNDYCLFAVEVKEDVPYSGSTVLASGIDISSCGCNDTRDVWHWYKPNNNGRVTISLYGSTFDTTLTILNACEGTELACNDDFCGAQSKVTLSVVRGKTYFIRVAGFGGQTGDYKLLITRNENTLQTRADIGDNSKVYIPDPAMFASCGLGIGPGSEDSFQWFDDYWLWY
jgi:beta propeller repeat protein